MAWDTSNRRHQLPPNWQDLRRQVKARAQGICEYIDNEVRCTTPGTECHHTGHNEDHSINKLQWICTEHHKRETWKQARQSQTERYITARKRPPETHPGLIS